MCKIKLIVGTSRNYIFFKVPEVARTRGRTSVWHATPRPKDSQDPALFGQLVPESKPQRQRVLIFCKMGCHAIVVADSHPPETQTIFLVIIFFGLTPAGRCSICEAGRILLDHHIGS